MPYGGDGSRPTGLAGTHVRGRQGDGHPPSTGCPPDRTRVGTRHGNRCSTTVPPAPDAPSTTTSSTCPGEITSPQRSHTTPGLPPRPSQLHGLRTGTSARPAHHAGHGVAKEQAIQHIRPGHPLPGHHCTGSGSNSGSDSAHLGHPQAGSRCEVSGSSSGTTSARSRRTRTSLSRFTAYTLIVIMGNHPVALSEIRGR